MKKNISKILFPILFLSVQVFPGKFSVMPMDSIVAPILISPVNGAQFQATINLMLTWASQSEVTNYEFEYSSDSAFSSSGIIDDLSIPDTSVNLFGLNSNTQYYWRVRAVYGSSYSNWSPIWNFRTTIPPSVPILLSPLNSSINQDTVLNLSWTNSNQNTSYTLEISSDASFSNNYLVFNKTIRNSTISISPLDYDTTYYWRVKSLNVDNLESDWSGNSEFKTRLRSPILLAPITGSLVNTDSIKLYWNHVKGARRYQIQLGVDSSFTQLTTTLFANTDSLSLPPLVPNTTYYIRLNAYDFAGDSSKWSEIISITTRFLIKLSQDTIKDTINLSDNPGDSLITISVSNNGPTPVFFDTISISPKNLFVASQNSFTIAGNTTNSFTVKLNSSNIVIGENDAIVQFKKSINGNNYETINVYLKIFIKAAIGDFSPDTLNFNTVAADSAGYLGISLRNFLGNTDLIISKYSFSNGDSSSFIFLQKPDTVKANSSNYISIQFKPKHPGVNKTFMSLSTNSYPEKVFDILLIGIGNGGSLSDKSVQMIKNLADLTFESINTNNKLFILKNTGNDPLTIHITFSKNYFGFYNSKSYKYVIAGTDSVVDSITYLAPNFNKQNFDTMKIYQNGFGDNPIVIPLKGGFDSAASVSLILANLAINNKYNLEFPSIINRDSLLRLSINPLILRSFLDPDSKFIYYKGGDTAYSPAYTYSRLDHYIDPYFITEKGITITGKLLIRGYDDKLVDSLTIFDNYSPQIIVNKYNFASSFVPLSVPDPTPAKANVKWNLFGFPFSSTYTDSVFHYFGGRKNMKDGQWMIYKYDPSAKGSYSIFNDEQFQPGSAYFFAQALVDTFNISNTYHNVLTRSLTDTIITFSSNSWKTVTSPYLFDVQVQPPAILLKYDTDNQSYVMTNIMKPGEGYFVDPAISLINLKTFGKYQPLTMPKIISDAPWHINLNVSDSHKQNDLFLSLSNTGSIAKIGQAAQLYNYSAPPRIQKGLYSYIQGESADNQYCSSVKINSEGGAWDVVFSNDLQSDIISVTPAVIGQLPSNFNLVIYDEIAKKIIDGKQLIVNTSKDGKYRVKIIAGTKSFINETLTNIENQLPSQFSLSQNYPNPFNPITTFNYTVPHINNTVLVKLKIYDILGNEVITLVNENKLPGLYEVKFDGSKYASGVYFYRFTAGSFVSVKKMILLK